MNEETTNYYQNETSVNAEIRSEFPAKPSEESKEQTIKRSLISVGLFIVLFYLVFKWDLAYIMVLAGIIFIHEFGHYLAMRIFKYKDLTIFFVPLVGAFASGAKENISQKQSVIILLSGPVPGLIIGIILFHFGQTYKSEFLFKTSNIFIFLNLFNLLPIMPLDGGRVLKSLFFENNEIINKIFIFISIAVLTYYSVVSQSYFLLLIPFFLITQLTSQVQVKKLQREIQNQGINLNKTFDELTDEEYWLIRDQIGTNLKYFGRFISPKKYVVSDNEQSIIKQVKSVIRKKPVEDLNIGGKILITAICIVSFFGPLAFVALYYLSILNQ